MNEMETSSSSNFTLSRAVYTIPDVEEPLEDVVLTEPEIKKSNSAEVLPTQLVPYFYNDHRDIQYTAFTRLQQLLIFCIIIYIGFLGPMAGNIYIPALPVLQREFGVSETTINATVSVFMGVFSVAPLFWGAYADAGGRKVLYLISLLLMTAINILLASLPKSIGGLFTLRIFQAFTSSSVISLGAGTVADITPSKNRGKAIAYFMMGPNMGPVVAPIVAGLILLDEDKWRWLFGCISIMSGTGFLLVLFLLPETLRCIVGNGDVYWQKRNDGYKDLEVTLPRSRWRILGDIGFLKPVSNSEEFQSIYPNPPKFKIYTYVQIAKFPPVFISSLASALLFSTYYGISVTLSHYLSVEYKYSSLKIGICYLSPGICMLLGSQCGGHLSDKIRKYWLEHNKSKSYPIEHRLILTVCGILISLAGAIGYGWSIQFHYHISMVLIFSGIMAFGLTWCNNTIMTYLSELLSLRVSAAIAVSSFFRNLGAAISSAVISKLCRDIGIGACFTGLGLINLLSIFGILFLINGIGKWEWKNK
ncbi:Dityrosine transporter 1 [Nakaseomyces bracarensis]|uniref:Dityrosine transporter 1 n=1 Tax=Nakaseomyces bracarensis TaxID=273131 RepID=A0ABR4P119_9SACH